MERKIKKIAEEVYKIGHKPGGCLGCPFKDTEMCGYINCCRGTVEKITTAIEEEYTKYKNLVEIIESYKDPILDDIEKEYLKNVLAPWLKRDDEIRIIKHKYNYGDAFWLEIDLKDDSIIFPDFYSKKMYAGMENNKSYTVEELGLR